MGKIKIRGNSYTGKELVTHQLPTFRQSVSGHSLHLFNELEKLMICLTQGNTHSENFAVQLSVVLRFQMQFQFFSPRDTV